MKRYTLRFWLVFCAAVALGVALHFLYSWMPNGITALFSPVRESLWEHLKVLFFPLLAAGLVLGGKQGRTTWLLSALVVCALMLLTGWLYHIALRQDALFFDLALYLLLMFLGFRLPKLLWPLSEWPGISLITLAAAVLLVLLVIFFTFFPPGGLLFQDLRGGVETFLTIPV